MEEKLKKICFLVFISIFLISCASNIKIVNNDSTYLLEENEGIILFRIINPNAGKVIDEFCYSNGEIANKRTPLHLNSDLQIKRSPGSFTVFNVANTEESEQIVLLKAKKGSYGIIKVGKNSEYFSPYVFKVTEGVINYVGDIKLDIVTGRVLVWHEVKDYYDLSVLDNFDEILYLRDHSDLLAQYSNYEFINQSKKIEPMKPLNCHVIRDK